MNKDASVFPTTKKSFLQGKRGEMATMTMVDVPGLTKRELFAAMIMQGFYSGDEVQAETFTMLAKLAVVSADALLEALSKEEEESPR